MRRSMSDMMTYRAAIKRIQENMGKKTTADEARNSLRACGVLNTDNQVVDVYRDIVIVKTVVGNKRHERK